MQSLALVGAEPPERLGEDAVEVRGHPVADFSLTPEELARHSCHDPETYGIDPAGRKP